MCKWPETRCDKNCNGWILSDAQDGRGAHIEKCDDCKRFQYDEDACEFVEKTWNRMLNALSLALTYITDPGGTYGFEETEKEINAAINEALGDDTPKTQKTNVIGVYHCPECGGTRVQGTAWVDLNLDSATNDEPPNDHYWCPDCADGGDDGHFQKHVCINDGNGVCQVCGNEIPGQKTEQLPVGTKEELVAHARRCILAVMNQTNEAPAELVKTINAIDAIK